MVTATVTDQYPVLDPSFRWNPHPIYAQMRREAPVYKMPHIEMGSRPWLLTRYDDCVALQSDPRFTKQYSKIDPTITRKSGSAAINQHMLTVDPPDHTRLRGLVHKAFTPRIINAMSARIQEIADSLINVLQDKSEADLVSEFAFPLPVTVIAELLGVPVTDRDKFRRWSQTIVLGASRGATSEAMNVAALEFMMYFHEMFDRRRAEPKEDLITNLVQVQEAGDVLSPQELISMVFLLLIAGHETTVNLIANGTLALLQNPDQLALLRGNPGLIKSAVEEMLRYEGPVGATTMRWALEDVNYRGVKIPAGELVLASLLGANRDPEVFENPHKFDITRASNRHIAFGHGIHYCLGAPLARIEGAIAINTLVKRLPTLALDADPRDLDWSPTLLLRSLTKLPVKW